MQVKSDVHLLVRATACDCLRELELAFPGILSSKVGHFYALSQAENTHIFQHYLSLLSLVLDHAVKKYVLALEQGHTPDSALSELLSHSDTLRAYSLPDHFKETGKLLMLNPSPSLPEGASLESSDIRRAVSFILDHYQLLSPPCLSLTLSNVLSTMEFTSLTPMILKGLMLQYRSCQDLLSFHLVLYLKWRFGDEICSRLEANSITMWFTLMASHPSLPHHQRELLLSYYLEWPQEMLAPTTDSEGELEEDDDLSAGPLLLEDHTHSLSPTVFDTYSIYCYKVKALKFQLMTDRGASDGVSSLPQLLSTVLCQVQQGISGAPVTSLFHLLLCYYPHHHASGSQDICKLVISIVKAHPKFIPYMIDFISSIQEAFPESSVPLKLLADYLQHISSSTLHPHLLPLSLLFLQHASEHCSINPLVVIEFITRVVRDAAVCEGGLWVTGSHILTIISTILRTHPTNSVFKGLTDLLELLSTNYNDIDVQDRARFYHQLILSVSGEKLSGILSLASDSSAASTLSHIVEARIADNTYPSASPVQLISEPFLSLKRVDLCEERFYKEETDGEATVTMTTADEGEIEENGKTSFSLQYIVQFESCPDRVPSQIYAAVLRLSTDGPYYPCPDVYIPYMACKTTAAPAKSTCKTVNFSFFPKQPVPAVFDTRVIFTTEGGVTYVCELGNIEVQFEDLLQPLPRPLIPTHLSYKQYFLQLWSRLESSQTTHQKEADFSLLSTLHLDLSLKEWEAYTKRLQLLLVPGSIVKGERCYLALLPPRFHLLMRVCHGNEEGRGVAIWLATDNWRCLSLVNDYLISSRNDVVLESVVS